MGVSEFRDQKIEADIPGSSHGPSYTKNLDSNGTRNGRRLCKFSGLGLSA